MLDTHGTPNEKRSQSLMSLCQHWLIVFFVSYRFETILLYAKYTRICYIKILAGRVKIFHIKMT
jgi:hypothetical protein